MNVIQFILIDNRSYLGNHNENPLSRENECISIANNNILSHYSL